MFRNARTVDRRVLRDVLLTGLETHVSFGKELSHYTTNNIDSITIAFSDATYATGTLLIGADGIHSRVRKQLLPSHNPLDTGGRIIFGKSPLSTELTDTFPAGMLQRMSMIRDPHAAIPSFTLLEPIVFPPSSSLPPHPDLPQDYVYWVTCVQQSDLASVLTPEIEKFHGKITPEVGVTVSKKLTSHFHPSLQTLFKLQDTTQTSIISISTHPCPLPTWESNPTITLMRDAAHVMPPTGASGCVTALRDAGNLVRLIGERGVKEGVRIYEEEMREYGSVTIERSLDAAVKMFGFKAREEWRRMEE
jgi:2-polyprenyl-6-methoxyphenol hydroxylase-like FAD-dependent oxidoreductase